MKDDDTGSLPLALLLILVGVMLSALLTPVLLTQLTSTRQLVQRVHAGHAAQAGLDVALGQIRAANNGAGGGVLARLPCGPLSGNVGGAGPARYLVTIDYLPADPLGQPEAWVTGNRIPCVTRNGPSSTPSYALLRSTGTDVATGAFGTVAGRSLQATYAFKTSNQSAPGGRIRVYKTQTSTDLCLDASSGSPAAGTNLRMRPCVPDSPQQTFAYNTNLTIVLVSSKIPALPLGMCLDAGVPHVAGGVVQFQPCTTTTRPQQQWSLNDQANFEGTANGATLDGFCFNVQSPDLAGSFVILGSVAGRTCRQGYDTIETFFPEASVGAGAAGGAANQVVNFARFSRCLDVTNGDVNYAYLIASPCQQAPDPANITWRQRWALPVVQGGATSATGLITTDPASTRYCLRSPRSIAAGRYVTVTNCPGNGTPPNLTWTVFTNTGAYATSYRITDSSGYCLAPTDPTAAPADLHPVGQQIGKMVVTTCDGSADQQWNAPPDTLQSTALKDIGER